MKLLDFERIFQHDPAEMVGREVRDTCEFQRFLFRKGITNLNCAVVINSDNIAGKGLFNVLSLLCHKDRGICKRDFLIYPVVHHFHPACEFAGTDPDKCYPVPVCGIHVCLNFKGKTRKGFFIRRKLT